MEKPRGRRKPLVRKVKVLVAVSPPGLFQVIQYLFSGRPEFEIVGSPRNARGMARHSLQSQPELILVNVKPLGTGVCETVRSLKRLHPASKLILICSVREFALDARRCGADACLDAEALVGLLLQTAQRLALAHQAELLPPEKEST